MRINKYRIFDKIYKEYCEEPDFRWTLSREGNLYNSENDEWHEPNTRYIIEYFTGLTDRNGKEICEGDIINSGVGEILWSELDCMFKVKWHGEIFKRVRGANDRYTLNGEPLFMNAHIAWEVIGNIHENTELLSTPTAVL
ncbi:YopX family protein [Flavobacterium sp. XS1P27]|uniref:YopX family protein n=1 Tax=Flavobacterium sp. XS1P27 TaxID=3401724 RepID=UPI003AAE557C